MPVSLVSSASAFRRTPALALAFAGFLTQLDVTAVIVAMPSIGGDLGFGIAGFAWVMDAYSIAFTGTLLASGALADRYGRRRMLLIGNALFAITSLACGLAWDGPSLWASRAAQGAAAAFVITGSIALTAVAYPEPADRTRAFALAGIVSGAAMAIGPTLGGVVATWWGWRWIFLANIPVCAFAGWIVPRLVAEERPEDSRPLDLTGIALLTLALGLFIETLLASSRSPQLLAAGFMASAGLAALFVLQQRRQSRPILDPALFARPAMVGVALLLVTVSVAYWAVLVYLPLFLVATFALSTEQAGLFLLAATLPMLVLPPLGGRLLTRWGWRRLFATGLAIIALGDLILAFVMASPHPFAAALTGMVVIAIGTAFVQAQLSGAVVALVPAPQAGMAAAFTIVMRQGGFAIGIAALGATLGSETTADSFPLVFALAAGAAMAGILAASLLPQKIERARHAHATVATPNSSNVDQPLKGRGGGPG